MSTLKPDVVASVLIEVMDERKRQHVRWGEQSHPDGTGSNVEPLAVMTATTPAYCYLAAAELAQLAREDCQGAFAAGGGTYQHVLKEEFFEALAEADPVLLRAELIQVAAVAVAWVEAIDRRAD